MRHKRVFVSCGQHDACWLAPLGGRKGGFVHVSAADRDFAQRFNWAPDTHGYPGTNVPLNESGRRQQRVLLHRMLAERLGWEVELQVDHENGVRTDCRRENLRKATDAQNRINKKRYTSNRSGFKGVHWHKQRRKWSASISKSGVRYELGLFDEARHASDAYEAAAVQLYGEFKRRAV